ncbi:MAG: NADH-quinone oxidoreductase subunit A [Ornithinimicrobium sp.]
MFFGILSMLAIALATVGATYGIYRLTAISPDVLASLPFQSGWVPEEHALSRYHARWYLATVLFLAFDVEMLFMYPWAVVVADLGFSAVLEMFLFLGALLVAVVWVWREGGLRWA